MELFKVTAPLVENTQKLYHLDLKTHPKKKLLNAFGNIISGLVFLKNF